jgi:hypothetical protein
MSPSLRPRVRPRAPTRPDPVAEEGPLAADQLAWSAGEARGLRLPVRWVVTAGFVAAAAVAVAAWPAWNARGEPVPDRPDEGVPGGATAPWAGGWPLFASAETRREERMIAGIEAARTRIPEKETIAAALIRGEITAERAIARFAFLLAEEPTGRAALRRRYPGVDDADLAIYMLIQYVERARNTDAAAADSVVAGLRAAVGAE